MEAHRDYYLSPVPCPYTHPRPPLSPFKKFFLTPKITTLSTVADIWMFLLLSDGRGMSLFMSMRPTAAL